MRNILNGIRDYIKDCWHDWLCKRVRAIDCRIFERVYCAPRKLGWELSFEWKEGSVWHYIKQRKIAAQKEHFADASKKIAKRMKHV